MRHGKRLPSPVFIAMVTAACLLTAGCTSTGSEEPETETTTPTVSTPSTPPADFRPAEHGISSHPGIATDSGAAAELVGTVRRHEGCLVLASEGLSRFSVPVFPDQALSMVDGQIVYTPYMGAPVSLAEGQQVAFGGGYFEIADRTVAEESQHTSITFGEGCSATLDAEGPADVYFIVANAEQG